MQHVMAITKALADESRLRILASLRGGELCLCQIVEVLGLAPSTVSKHVELLFRAGLVERRKDGRWHYYRLVEAEASQVAREAISWVLSSVATEGVIGADETRLRAIRNRDPRELTGCYTRIAAANPVRPELSS